MEERLDKRLVINLQEDEIKTWRRFQQGDERAFASIFEKHSPVLYHYGIKFFQDEALVEDCIQDLFLELWKKRAALSLIDSTKYYLIASLRRLLLRKQQAAKKHNIHYTPCLPEYSEESAEIALLKEQLLNHQEQALRQAISQLPARQKEAIQLKFFQGKSYQEITAMMGISYQTARKFIYKAVQNLRKNVSDRVPTE